MILDKIAAATQVRVADLQNKISLATVRRDAEALVKAQAACGLLKPGAGKFYENLRRPGLNFICEVKKASPSKGLIAKQFNYLQIAREYEHSDAAAISCLTEPEFFQGRDQYLKEIVKVVSTPVLRKDFTLTEYQIYEAKNMGASAVLLICALLSTGQLKEYRQLAESLGLDVLVEIHDEAELQQALKSEAKIIGINNRNLKNFTLNIANSFELRKLVPENKVCISESGIRTAQDISNLASCSVNAVLIGETLMRSDSISDKLQELRSLLPQTLKQHQSAKPQKVLSAKEQLEAVI